MESLLERAFEALKTLPEVDRERIAREIIERVEDKTEWDRIVSSPDAQRWLQQQARQALKVYRKMRDKLSLTFVSVSQDKLLREEAYWTQLDELPLEIRKLAEENDHSFKENPQYGPALQTDPCQTAHLLPPRGHAPQNGRRRGRRRQGRVVLGRLLRDFQESDRVVEARGPTARRAFDSRRNAPVPSRRRYGDQPDSIAGTGSWITIHAPAGMACPSTLSRAARYRGPSAGCPRSAPTASQTSPLIASGRT